MEQKNNDLSLSETRATPKTVGEILWNKKGLIFLSTFVTLSVVFISTLLIKPVYQINSKILIKEKSLNPAELTISYTRNEEFLQDQAEIISSTSNILKALKSGMLRDRFLEQSNTNAIDIERLQKDISVAPVNKTNIIELKVENTDPSLAKSLSTTLVSTYQDTIRTTQKTSLDNSLLAITNATESNLKALTKAEEELEEYVKKEKVAILPETEIVLDLKRFANFDTALIDVDSEIQKVNTKINAVDRELATTATNNLTLPFIINNSVINALQDKLQTAEIALSNLVTEYTSFHPEVIKTYKNIRELKAALENEKNKIIDSEMESYNIEKDSLESKRMILYKSNKNYTEKLQKTLASQPKLSSLLNNIKTQRRIHEDLLSKQTDLQILIARINNTSGISIISPPQMPLYPLRPNLTLNLLLGLFAGFALGCSFAITSPEQPKYLKENKLQKELRKKLRFPLSTDIIYSSRKEPYIKHQAFSLNCSESGLSFSSEYKPNKNDILNLEILPINGNSIIVKGKVIWTHEVSLLENGNGPFNSGIKFIKINQKDREHLLQSCSRLSKI